MNLVDNEFPKENCIFHLLHDMIETKKKEEENELKMMNTESNVAAN